MTRLSLPAIGRRLAKTPVGLALLAVAANGCIDPKADYEDYLQRPVAVRDSGAQSDVAQTPCQELLKENLNATYYVKCIVKSLNIPFSLFVDQTIVPSPDGLTAQLDMSFTPLIVNAATTADTTGSVVTLKPTTIDGECRFLENVGTLILPAAANTTGRDLEAQNVTLRGKLLSVDRTCAELDGNVPLVNLSLAMDGDICVYIRTPPSTPVPAVTMDDYVCDPSILLPR